ncbi:hypothetical protein C2G38_2212403 [Gigaspora rosea]|uniref:Uncharacterized protein n=1 Tax=Gigaspora rosea TaxID=44941 RepID=A0A397UG28_9GLOM|nr:hypothetical protein C2G38_2212403 [Gigaspora rosea]
MANIQSKINSLEEQNSKLIVEITEFKKKYAGVEAENIEVKAENAKLRRFIKENTELKTRIEELEKNRIETTTENTELKARVAKLEQNFEHRLEDSDNSSENIVNVPNPVIDQCVDTNSKSLEDKNQSQDLSPVNHSISSDILCNTEIINDQDSRKQKKGEALIQEILLEKNHINENLSSDQKSTCITNAEASSLRETLDNCESRPYRAKNIINLYQNACNAEESAMKANQEEILCWCLYAKEFKDLVGDFMTKYNVSEKKAKGLVYGFIIEQLPNTKRENLCKQTQRAIKIFNLFEKIGTDKQS